MKVLVTGISGQLGFDVCKILSKYSIEFLGTDRNSFNIIDESSTNKFIQEYRPNIIVHCAAYTAVDKAEDEKELCYSINVKGTEYIAKAAKQIDATMIYISTDYVFDGTKQEPYQTDDVPNPLNQYGKTKLEGEIIVQNLLSKYFIVRTSWVFGINGNNFIKTMLRLGKERDYLNIVADQIGSPTYTVDLSHYIYQLMLLNGQYGIYHITNDGYCSWAEFAYNIFNLSNISTTINNISSEEYATKAIRPKNSKLAKNKLHEINLSTPPHWLDALKRYLIALHLNEAK